MNSARSRFGARLRAVLPLAGLMSGCGVACIVAVSNWLKQSATESSLANLTTSAKQLVSHLQDTGLSELVARPNSDKVDRGALKAELVDTADLLQNGTVAIVTRPLGNNHGIVLCSAQLTGLKAGDIADEFPKPWIEAAKFGRPLAFAKTNFLGNEWAGVVVNGSDAGNGQEPSLVLLVPRAEFIKQFAPYDVTSVVASSGWIVVAVVLAFLFGPAPPLAKKNTRLSTRLAEFTLLSVSVIVLGMSVYLGVQKLEMAHGARTTAEHTALLQEARSLITARLVQGPKADAEVTRAASVLNQAGKPGWAESVGSLSVPGTRAVGEKAARVVLASIDRDLAKTARNSSTTARRQEWVDNGVVITLGLGLAIVLTTVCYLLLTRQNRETMDDDLKVHEKKLYDHEQLVEGMPIGVIAIVQGRAILANREWRSMFDCQEGDDVLQSFAERLHPDDRRHALQALGQSEKYRTTSLLNVRCLGRGGTIAQTEIRVMPIQDAAGRHSHMLGFAIDVTVARRAELLLQEQIAKTKEANEYLRASLSGKESQLDGFVWAMVRAIEAKDPGTAGHSQRVAQYCVQLARELKMDETDVRILELGAAVHDIGKIGVPESVLCKPSKLTAEEYREIKRHTVIGYDILKSIAQFQPCLDIVRSHHELLDGSGYPDGLRGDEIPLVVRVATVADIFDSLTSTRTYRDRSSPKATLELLASMAEDGKLDADVVRAMAMVVKTRGIIPQLDDETRPLAA